MSVCVCMCERERATETEIERQRKTERERQKQGRVFRIHWNPKEIGLNTSERINLPARVRVTRQGANFLIFLIVYFQKMCIKVSKQEIGVPGAFGSVNS